MVAGKDHSSGNTGKEVKASGENRKKILNPHLTASLHIYHSAVSWLQKENLAAKAQCETQYQLYHLAATHTPAVQEGKDALSPPATSHSLALATSGNDALEEFLFDVLPALLETGNIPKLDSTMTLYSSQLPKVC